MKKSLIVRALLTGTTLGLSATHPSIAQAAPAVQAPVTSPDDARLDDIIVTAQRRSERLQDVPISITAADATALAQQRVFNVENITSISPSISFRKTNLASASSNIQIRGIGTSGISRSFEGSVGVFVDGVYRTRSGQALGNFLDIDSLQILRGPQGTLFGKNTSAGALLLTSASPSPAAVGGRFEASYGNYNAYRVSGAINLPLSETTAIRIAAIQTDHDGYVRNVNGGGLNESKDRAVKVQLLFEPSSNLKVQLIGDYAKSTGNCCYGTVRVIDGPTRPLVDFLTVLNGKQNASTNFNDYQGSISPDTPNRVEDYGGTALIDVSLGNGVLKSITALRQYSVSNGQDADFSGADILHLTETFSSRFFSQELNYTGNLDGGIKADYIFGAFFSDEQINIERSVFHGSQGQVFWDALLGGAFGLPAGFSNAAPGQFIDELFDQKSNSYALFTHWDFKVAERWNVIVGIRGSKEVKSGGGRYPFMRDPVFDPFDILGLTPAIPYRARSDDEAISGTLGIQYHPSRDAMLYLTYNRGFKAGGVNLDDNAPGVPGSSIAALAPFLPATTTNPVYKKETIDAVEGGLKIDWLDHKARTNFSIFYNSLSNLQVAQFLGLRFTVLNAPTAEVYGAEIEQTFKLSPQLTLTGAATYLPMADFGISALLGAPLSGRRFATAPEFAGQAALNGNFPLSDKVVLTGRVQVQYTSKVFTNTADNETQDGFALVNANLGLTLSNRFTIEGWVQNLTDKRYVTQHFQLPLQSGSTGAYVGAPRTYGVTLRASF
jgi:outer membrane receptor protein involved in Fe transport